MSEPEKPEPSNSENEDADLRRSPCTKPPLCVTASMDRSVALARAILFHPDATVTELRRSPVTLKVMGELSLKRCVCSAFHDVSDPDHMLPSHSEKADADLIRSPTDQPAA